MVHDTATLLRVTHLAFESQVPEQFKLTHLSDSRDPICAITAQQHMLMVARSSGTVLAFSLPSLSPEGQFLLGCRPQRMQLNCDCSRLAVIDFNGVLRVMAILPSGPGSLQAEAVPIERKVCQVQSHLLERQPQIKTCWHTTPLLSVPPWHEWLHSHLSGSYAH